MEPGEVLLSDKTRRGIRRVIALTLHSLVQAKLCPSAVSQVGVTGCLCRTERNLRQATPYELDYFLSDT